MSTSGSCLQFHRFLWPRIWRQGRLPHSQQLGGRRDSGSVLICYLLMTFLGSAFCIIKWMSKSLAHLKKKKLSKAKSEARSRKLNLIECPIMYEVKGYSSMYCLPPSFEFSLRAPRCLPLLVEQDLSLSLLSRNRSTKQWFFWPPIYFTRENTF